MDALPIMLSVISLLFIATGVFFLSKKTSIPYTILLVIVGLLLIPVSELAPFHFFQSFTLTPGLLFFVFLPTLIFESAYNMNVRNMIASVRSISLLSIVSLLISAFFIAFFLKLASTWVGFPIPFEVALIFGSLISATDPVAVLALFKEYGVPRRLSLIFEGESLFNDGTSLALFLVVLEVLTRSSAEVGEVARGLGGDIIYGTILFIVTVVGGALFGLFMGTLFSKLIQRVHNNEAIEITLTMIVAHATFMLSEIISSNLVVAGHHLHFSSIIATVVAAIVVGNYGRYKISPAVLEYMEHFWGYFAFVANSIIFILIGLLFSSLPVSLIDILPIALLTIAVVMIARALSIYPVVSLLNWSKQEEQIPMSWQHLMAWGSLRGALAITMVLLIPDTFTVTGWEYEYTVKEFITALTIVCIYFTLFVKGMTIGPMIKYFRLSALNKVEQGEYFEAKALLYTKLLLEIERFFEKGYITQDIHDLLKQKYEQLYHRSCTEGKTAFNPTEHITERVLTIYALATAKHSLKTLFIHNEVSEGVYKKILNDLVTQVEHVEKQSEVLPITFRDFSPDWLDRSNALVGKFFGEDPNLVTKEEHMFYRARAIISKKALEEIESLAQSDLEVFDHTPAFQRMTEQLRALNAEAQSRESALSEAHQQLVKPLAIAFAEAGLLKARKQHVHILSEREIITPKVTAALHDEIEADEHLTRG